MARFAGCLIGNAVPLRALWRFNCKPEMPFNRDVSTLTPIPVQ